MFLCSVRMSKVKFVLLFAAVLAVGAVGVIVLTSALRGTGAPAPRLPEDLSGGTEEERTAFLAFFGWEVAASAELGEVTIPAVFDDVYERYNAIQKEQGFDLEPFKDRAAQRYVYRVTNYPGGGPNVYAHLLVCEGKIIGGDVASNELGGFMHGFKKPETA